jgi:hypothetical protein
MVVPWGCVSAICFGRQWSFYPQENVSATTLEFVKKGGHREGRRGSANNQERMLAG